MMLKASTIVLLVLNSQLVATSLAFTTGFRPTKTSSFHHKYAEHRKDPVKTTSTLLKSTAIDKNSLSGVVGEADQSFRMGIELEKKGLVCSLVSQLFLDDIYSFLLISVFRDLSISFCSCVGQSERSEFSRSCNFIPMLFR